MSTAFLGITLLFLIKQTRSTESLVRNELRPSIFVYLRADTIANTEEHLEKLGTVFFFRNLSQFSALVWITAKLTINGEDHSSALGESLLGKIPAFRVSPIGELRTAPYAFLADAIRKLGIQQVDDLKGKEVYLEIKLLASPSFNSNLKFTCDLRSYRFDFDFFKWIDNKLGISDE